MSPVYWSVEVDAMTELTCPKLAVAAMVEWNDYLSVWMNAMP